MLEQQRLRAQEEDKAIEEAPVMEEITAYETTEDEGEDLENATIYSTKASNYGIHEDQTAIIYCDKTEEDERKEDEKFLSVAAPKTAATALWKLPRKSTVEFYGEAWDGDGSFRYI